MSKHIFNLRLSAAYESSDNKLASLDVQVLGDDGWVPLDLNTMTPGFLIYVYSMFTCQHLYLRTNGNERELHYATSEGSILVEASEDWHLETVAVNFDVRLARCNANPDDIDYIVSRMKQCPVSKNLPQGIDIQTSVVFNSE